MAIQNNDTASEQFSENEQWFCLGCREAIFNPLCPVCLLQEIDVWLASYPDELRNRITARLRGYIDNTEKISGKSTQCVICSKPRTSLCPYCFTSQVLELLKQLQVSSQVLKEFLEFFNFDFEHTGYSKEAERLGVI